MFFIPFLGLDRCSCLFAFLGELDFIIDSEYKWGVELMRGDGNITEHLFRFESGGKYEWFPLTAYRVVHFKSAPWRPRTTHQNYIAVAVSLSEGFATIIGHDAEDMHVSFRR